LKRRNCWVAMCCNKCCKMHLKMYYISSNVCCFIKLCNVLDSLKQHYVHTKCVLLQQNHTVTALWIGLFLIIHIPIRRCHQAIEVV
jgi:hypothetical protein